jgi:hypothetical protein
MQAVTMTDFEKFLKYVTVRPKKYASNVWKISEVFATWMISSAPVVAEE